MKGRGSPKNNRCSIGEDHQTKKGGSWNVSKHDSLKSQGDQKKNLGGKRCKPVPGQKRGMARRDSKKKTQIDALLREKTLGKRLARPS